MKTRYTIVSATLANIVQRILRIPTDWSKESAMQAGFWLAEFSLVVASIQ